MAKHYKRKSFTTIIFELFLFIIILVAIFSSLFDSWQNFVVKSLEVIPFGKYLFKAMASLVDATFTMSTNSFGEYNFVTVVVECTKLLLAALFLPIARYLCGFAVKGKHAEEVSGFLQRIWLYIVEKLFVPLVVAIVSAWIVTWISGMIEEMGGVSAVILSIMASMATVGVSVWAFATLMAKSLGWGVAYMLFKLVPAMMSALFSDAILVLLLVIGSAPELLAVAGSCIMIFLVLLILMGVLENMLESVFRTNSGNKHIDWI